MSQARFIGTSVGKKALMAVTGLSLCAFLLVHLIGNIALLIKDDGSLTMQPGASDAGSHFIGVMATYGKIPALLYLLETLLAGLFLTHMVLGVSLWLRNRWARGGTRYRVHRSEGGRSLGSASMPFTGIAVIFTFLVVHLINFRLSPNTTAEGMYLLVDSALSIWYWALIYAVALLGLGLHLSHGLQSAFQSLGLNHPRWTPMLKKLGWAFALLILAGFGSLPLLFVLKGVLA